MLFKYIKYESLSRISERCILQMIIGIWLVFVRVNYRVFFGGSHAQIASCNHAKQLGFCKRVSCGFVRVNSGDSVKVHTHKTACYGSASSWGFVSSEAQIMYV
jgi:hypothetical protein